MKFTPTSLRSEGIIHQGGRYQNKVDNFASLCRFSLSAKKVERVPFVLPMNLDMLSVPAVVCFAWVYIASISSRCPSIHNYSCLPFGT